MTTHAWRRSAVAFAIAFALVATGCRETTIARILAEPQRYTRDRNEQVGLVGDVIESISLLGHGAYKLDDGTGTIWIVSKHGVPRKGARVGVKGKIKDVVDVSTIIKLPQEIGSGLVMLEDRHRAR